MKQTKKIIFGLSMVALITSSATAMTAEKTSMPDKNKTTFSEIFKLTDDKWKQTLKGVYYYEFRPQKYLIDFVHPELRVPPNYVYYLLIDTIREIRLTLLRHTTKVFAKAGLDNATSAMCKHQQRFGLDVQCSALVHNLNNIFPNGHLYRAVQSMNSLPSQILQR